MRKWPHGIVDVDRVMNTVRNGGACLLVISIGVPHADHQPGVPRSFNTRHGAKQFRRNRDELRMTTRRRNEFCEHFRGRQVNPFVRMDARPHWADERSFEVNPQDFGA